MPSLFISYRRTDSPDTVKLLHERLKRRLPRWEIFYDHESIPLGEQFPERLRAKVASADVVLVIIGPKWLEILQERKGAAVDHVRAEVQFALEATPNVLPVLVGHAAMPTDADLADFADLQPLLQRNGRPVRPDPDFDGDLERLIAHFKQFESDETVGATLADKYTLTAEIGHGGMGVVYRAEQKQPVKRTVAVKLIKPGMDSRDVLARFDAERQALAVMDHPNIAKVHDAGMTAGGRPFFVMEYVKGVPITQYCDEKKLTPQERLNLFIPVSNAVQHAHQKGILHRDLKPSNVLVEVVDGKPVPKVIDFGLAKALGHKLTEKTLYTALDTRIGTLEYSAPEQAAGRSFDVDTRSDIYSLGVMLYELLTGAPPFTHAELLKIGEEEMRRVIREDEPTKPSKKLSSSGELPAIAANRHLEPNKLTRLVQNDLDWIVMKCLEKENARRYETANQLGLELQRFLVHEPVQAGPPSASYRVKKFLRRNRGPVIAAALVVMALIAGVIGTSIGLVQAQQAREAEAKQGELTAAALAKSEENRKLAEKRFDEKRGALDEMLQSFSDDRLKLLPGSQQIRQVFFEKGLEQYTQILRERQDDPAIQARLADSYRELGVLRSEVGVPAEALTALQKAVALRRQMTATAPDDAAVATALGHALFQLGQFHFEQRQTNDAVAPVQESVDLFTRLVTLHPGDALYKAGLGRSLTRLASLKPDLDQEKTLVRACELLQEAAHDMPADADVLTELARALNNLVVSLPPQRQSAAEGLGLYDKARKTADKALELNPAHSAAHSIRSRVIQNRAAQLAKAGRESERLQILEEALSDSKTFVRKNPAVVRAGLAQVSLQEELARSYQKSSKLDESIALWEDLVRIHEGLAQRNPQSPQHVIDAIVASQNIADIYRTNKREPDAIIILDKVIKQAEPTMRLHSTSTDLLRHLLFAHRIRGEMSFGVQQYEKAREAYQGGVDLFTRYRLSVNSPEEYMHYHYLICCRGLRSIAREQKETATAIALATKLIVPIKLESFSTVDLKETLIGEWISLASLYEDNGNIDEALRLRLRAVEEAKKLGGGDPKSNWNLYYLVIVEHAYLARLYGKTGNQRREFEAIRNYLKETQPYLYEKDHSRLLEETADFTLQNLSRLREASGDKSWYGRKVFTLPVEFDGAKRPWSLFVTESWHFVEDQFDFVEKVQGGKVPKEIVDSFRRIYMAAKENKVSFQELCVYALGTTTKEVDAESPIMTSSSRLDADIIAILQELAAAKRQIQPGKGDSLARKRLALKYARLVEEEVSRSRYFRATHLLAESLGYIDLDSFDRLRDPNDSDIYAYIQYVQGALLGGGGELVKGYSRLIDSMQTEPEKGAIAPFPEKLRENGQSASRNLFTWLKH